MKFSVNFTAIIAVTFVLLTISCDKIFVRVEGQDATLQGKWQQTDKQTDYYNFQNNVFQYQTWLNKDSAMSVTGYYTFQGDTALYLELYLEQTLINYFPAHYPLDFMGWDTTLSFSGEKEIVRLFKIKELNNQKLSLTFQAKDSLSQPVDYLFRKF